MTLPAQNQQQKIAALRLIEDAHERLAAVVDHGRKRPPLPDSERVEANRVLGCSSRVWLVAAYDGGRCTFRVDADSTLVRSLATLICEIYDGCAPAQIIAHESCILEELRLSDQLTPTRRHGLRNVQRAIHEFAARCIPTA